MNLRAPSPLDFAEHDDFLDAFARWNNGEREQGPDVTPWPIRVVFGLLVLVVVVAPFVWLGWKLWHARSGIR